ncbi:uncharacterized protein LOC115584441 isoform X2 [Sparus aurata]|uniref:uncharacterized protein LOC115584441 isoform X2 n=1 Tax=Sparus aurata TaxID=8175 RepID=UPI0011C108E6|nr:uncharacterized protein LOC115584441 isoform X2 [Sparus aurata]
MCARRVGITGAFVALVMSPLLLEGVDPRCNMTNQRGFVEGSCPVTMTPVRSLESGKPYTEHVAVHVWMKADDFCKNPRIEVLSPHRKIYRPTMRPKMKKCNNEKKKGVTRVKCDREATELVPNRDTSLGLWKLELDHIKADVNSVVSVAYSSTSVNCSVSHTVPDPVPDFDLSVNRSSKSITVTVETGDKVYTRWCYRKSAVHCMAGNNPGARITIDPSQSRSALLNIPYLLPCVCIEAYYTNMDALRRKKCPFQNQSVADVRDVWASSEVTLFESRFKLQSPCPASDLKISASLCWKQQEHLCIPVLNSTLEDEEEDFIYNTAAVDRHPRMCVRFSLQGSHNISCPFPADMSSWEVYMAPGRQSVFLHLTSSVPATFSAQLCVPDERGCTPMGQVHSLTMDGNTTERRINMPLRSLAERPCVQVWQSDPALRGKRILCPDYAHNRRGMFAVAALVFVVLAAFLGIFIHRLTKTGTAGWLCIQEPVLLVCSSEQSAHISAVCALASILQAELSATVHLPLWALGSQTQTGAGTGVADLGPLPWLYGRWEAVRKAQGKVLIVWSPEAKKSYERWREDRLNLGKNESKERDKAKVEDDLKINERKCKKEKTAGDCVKLCDDKDRYQKEASTVIAPVFTAALACLEGALEGCKGQEVALVYFEGRCHSRDIPKAFRGVPRYCLPRDLSGLIQELGGMRRQTQTGKFSWLCWPRLMSKVLSIWLARQLAQRLQTLLPQMQGKQMEGPGVTSSLKMMSEKTQSRLKLPVERPGTVQEHEPLRGWRPEML